MTLMRFTSIILSIPIRFYRLFVSPLFPPACRFYPSCSEYALQAVQQYHVPKALFLIVKRILRCHPFHPGGYDPLPKPDGAP